MGHGDPKMNANKTPLDFAQIGAIFNDATTKLEGGVTAQNQSAILKDLAGIQTNLQTLLQQHPEQFTGLSAIHAQNIVDQLNLETQAIHSLGTDPYAAKYINDVQRDLIDIVQGDQTLATLATQHGGNGFAAVPAPLVPATPFPGSQVQTEFMTKFVADAQSLGQKAVALEQAGAAPNSAETTQLVQDVQQFLTQTNQFTVQQGGLYSARFNNEFALDGVNGTASRALIHGLQTGNAGEVSSAADVLAANAADVAGNMLGFGQTPAPKNNGIPDHITTFAQAGTVFNDATTKLIGGIFDGINNDGNRQSILNDLSATQAGLKGIVAADPATFSGTTGHHVQTIINDLAKEMGLVQAAGTGVADTHAIGALQKDILSTIQHDKTLQTLAMADGANGFMALPQTLHQQMNGANGQSQGRGNGRGHDNGQDDQHATDATPIATAPALNEHDPAAHVFTGHHEHMWG